MPSRHKKPDPIALCMTILLSALFLLDIQGASAASPSEIQEWLQGHNGYRSIHGMPDVAWSDTVAASAQAWADTCPSGHSGSQYGENMAFATYQTAHENIVGWWYGEEPLYDYDSPGFSPDTGHFTQVVWKNTTQIGCGYASGCSGGWPEIWVCQYNPPGNYRGQFAANVSPPLSRLWPDPSARCGGWCDTWLGWVEDSAFPWVFHDNFGWLHVQGTSPDDLWLWNSTHGGFWWTNEATYPYVWFNDDAGWFWYSDGTTPAAWFMDFSGGQWVVR